MRSDHSSGLSLAGWAERRSRRFNRNPTTESRRRPQTELEGKPMTFAIVLSPAPLCGEAKSG
jgi:hypothetical protein